MAAVRCRAALDVGVEVVYVGVSPGFRLEEAAGAEAALDERRDAAGRSVVSGGGQRRSEEESGVERLLEEVRREFSGLPVTWGVEDGYVKKTAPMDKRQFRRCLETCRRLGFRFDRGLSRWRSCSLQKYRQVSSLAQPPQDTHTAPPPSPHTSSSWTG